MNVLVICIALGYIIGDWVIPGPSRGLFAKQVLSWLSRFPKWILRLPKQHQQLTELARTQEDKEIEVIIQELDKELAERNS